MGGQRVVECHAGHEGGGEPGLFTARVVVEDRHDVIALHPAGRLHLVLEAGPEVLLLGELAADDLQRDRLVAPGTGEEDGSHAALTDLGEQLVAGDLPRIVGPERSQYGVVGVRHPVPLGDHGVEILTGAPPAVVRRLPSGAWPIAHALSGPGPRDGSALCPSGSSSTPGSVPPIA